jgi:syntaxin-binding protein 5
MASFLRGKQAGIQNDLSAAILPGMFAIDDRARYGINSQVRYSFHEVPGAENPSLEWMV